MAETPWAIREEQVKYALDRYPDVVKENDDLRRQLAAKEVDLAALSKKAWEDSAEIMRLCRIEDAAKRWANDWSHEEEDELKAALEAK